MGNLTVKTGSRRIKTAPSLYGLFFEDINRSGDGGLYPEALRNRAFDDGVFPSDLIVEDGDLKNQNGWKLEYQYGEGQKRWKERHAPTDIPAWYAENATMTLDKEHTLNEKREAALAVSFAPNGRIFNIGFCGVPVKAGESYHFYCFARTTGEVKLNVMVQKDGETLCGSEICVKGDAFARYDVTLTANRTEKEAIFVLEAPEGGDVTFGFTSLMPEKTFCGHGLRTDLCETLKALKPAFLRFPGGCIVEGFSRSTPQRFKRMIGPVWERPGVMNLWGYRSTEGLGYHEYLQLCEDLGADALYVCNCGMTCQVRGCILMEQDEIDDLLDDALCALEYALGPVDSKWGSLRAANGHPEPFALKYLEIGNENNGPDYEKRYEYFRKEICARYPELIIVANTHVEKSNLPLDIADEHFYDKTEWFAENSHFYDGYDRKGPEVFVGEFAVVAGHIRTLYAALGEAMFMVGMERNQDVVTLAAYAPLFENVKYAAWEPNLIAFDGLNHYEIPSYYVWKMFNKNKGDFVLESELACDELVAPYLKGGPCLVSSADVRFKNATWKGASVEPAQNIFGHVEAADGAFKTCTDTEGPGAEMAKRFGMSDTVLITLDNDLTSRAGEFSVDLMADEGKTLGIGLFAAPYGKARNSEDSPWNLFSVQPIRWLVRDGKSELIMGIGFRQYALHEAVPVELEPGKYYHFSMESDGKMLYCRIDGKEIMKVALPHYPVMQSIVLEEGEDIIVKLVNIGEAPISLPISLDCAVESDYTSEVLTGDPAAKNTMEEPEAVVPVVTKLTGADKSFTYEVAASSVTVLRIKRKTEE